MDIPEYKPPRLMTFEGPKCKTVNEFKEALANAKTRREFLEICLAQLDSFGYRVDINDFYAIYH